MKNNRKISGKTGQKLYCAGGLEKLSRDTKQMVERGVKLLRRLMIYLNIKYCMNRNCSSEDKKYLKVIIYQEFSSSVVAREMFKLRIIMICVPWYICV